MSVSPHDRLSAIFTTVARAVCWAPEPSRSAKFNSRRDNPSDTSVLPIAQTHPKYPQTLRQDLRGLGIANPDKLRSAPPTFHSGTSP
jgi:hypothetical protein